MRSLNAGDEAVGGGALDVVSLDGDRGGAGLGGVEQAGDEDLLTLCFGGVLKPLVLARVKERLGGLAGLFEGLLDLHVGGDLFLDLVDRRWDVRRIGCGGAEDELIVLGVLEDGGGFPDGDGLVLRPRQGQLLFCASVRKGSTAWEM